MMKGSWSLQYCFQIGNARFYAFHRVWRIVMFNKWNIQAGQGCVIKYPFEIDHALANRHQCFEVLIKILDVPDGEAARCLLEKPNRINACLCYPRKIEFHLDVG